MATESLRNPQQINSLKVLPRPIKSLPVPVLHHNPLEKLFQFTFKMSSTCFYISTIGQLESVHFPLGVGSKSVHCRYEVVHGPDWELVSGQRSGITQCASVGNKDFQTITFNLPLEFTFKATNPFGCEFFISSLCGFN